MKFPYKLYRVTKAPSVPEGMIWRPRIPVLIIGPTGELRIEALIDTGSDQTIFPQVDMSRIGADIDADRKSQVRGLASHEEELSLGKSIKLGLQLDNETYVWPAMVWLSNAADSPALLGRSGFLEYFDVTFYGKKLEVELKPTSGFPGVVSDLWE